MRTVLQQFPILIVHYSLQFALQYCSLWSYVVIIAQKISLKYNGEQIY